MFNKKEYWDRRSKGMRGQGAHPYQAYRFALSEIDKKAKTKSKAKTSKTESKKGNKGNLKHQLTRSEE